MSETPMMHGAAGAHKSPLDLPRCVTFFTSHTAQTKREELVTLRALVERIGSTRAPAKAALPWLKLAAFGGTKTQRGSLRHDDNVISISGIEADYDGETITPERARAVISQANLAAVIYTSPSHTAAAPRWRVLCPTSSELPPDRRELLVARLNGLFVGALAAESFTLSQSYYFGFVDGSADHQVIMLDGRCIDEADDLDESAVFRPKKVQALSTLPVPARNIPRDWQGGTHYGRAGLERECNAIRSASDGHKHRALNKTAYSIGGLVAAGELEEYAAMSELRAAVADIRDRCEDYDAALRTLGEAFEAGKAAPRQAPPPREVRHTIRVEIVPPEPPPIEEPPEYWAAEPEPEIPAAEPAKPSQPSAPAAQALQLLDPTLWDAPPPPRRWIVEGWVPVGVVSAKYGDGGIGKTLAAQQLMTAVALGEEWLGLPTTRGRALGIFCEDDEHELHRRQIAINASLGASMGDLAHMRLLSRLGEDNSLVQYDATGSYLTAFHAQVMAACADWRPDLVVLDTAADLYPDNENDRSKVRWFIQAGLARIARDFQCAVLLLAHPSASGLSSGSGTGGSTAWNNTVRSRIYLAKEEGEDADPNVRIMSKKKSNYGAQGGDIRLTWRDGVLEPVGKASAAAPVPWETVSAIFDQIQMAWEGERPWSNAWQAKSAGRYLPTWIKFKFGIPEKKAAKMIEAWQVNGCLVTETHNTHSKATGLKVIRRPDR